MNSAHYKKGISLIEMLVYMVLLTMLVSAVVYMMLSMNNSYKAVVVERRIESSAMNSMERMSREIRASNFVDLAESSLGVSNGVLTVSKTVNSVTTVTKFYISNGVLTMDVDGAYVGPLTTQTSAVTSLTFNRISNSNAQAIKIDMTIQSTSGSFTKTKTYHTTIVMKG